ncbi:MAG TPA: deoxyribose-phosphate aldolase [Vicinamibacterales bacterium]|nr:deoxyribose-phosphate aldolase [Vicinamibacterales bacterium]
MTPTAGAEEAITRGPAPLIDHTLLKADATAAAIDALCDEAARFGFAAVCVNPVRVRAAAERLRGTTVATCAVVGFPLGALTAGMKRDEAVGVIADGAREIDMVMNVGALKSADPMAVLLDIEAVTAAAAEAGAPVKVIIEAALLTEEEKVAACVLARGGGAAWVKTSTGFGPGGAVAADVRLMRQVVGDTMGIKAAGGIRRYAELLGMVDAGATRIGTSAGPEIMKEWKRQAAR